ERGTPGHETQCRTQFQPERRRLAEQRTVEELRHTPLVLPGPRIEATDVPRLGYTPQDLRRPSCSEVLDVEILAGVAAARVDEEDGPRSDPGDERVEGRRRHGAAEDGDRSGLNRELRNHHPPARPPDQLLAYLAGTCTLRDDRAQARIRRRRLEHHLAADRETDAPDGVVPDAGT